MTGQPKIIDPKIINPLDAMLIEVFSGHFPNDAAERVALKAASMAAAVRVLMKKEGLTVVRDRDVVILQGEAIKFNLIELEAAGSTQEDFVSARAVEHAAAVASEITKRGLIETALGAMPHDSSERAVQFKTRLWLPGYPEAAVAAAQSEAAELAEAGIAAQ